LSDFNDSYQLNYSTVCVNDTSNVTSVEYNESYSNISLYESYYFLNVSSNGSLENGSNYSQYNATWRFNKTEDNVTKESEALIDSLNFSSPRNRHGYATGLIRSYWSNVTKVNVTEEDDTAILHYTATVNDRVELPHGLIIEFSNFSKKNYLPNNTLFFNGTQEVYWNETNPKADDGSPVFKYSNVSVNFTFVNNSTAWWQEDSLNLTGFEMRHDDYTLDYKNCALNVSTNSVYYKNDSNVTHLNNTSKCYFHNGSLEVNTTIKLIIIHDVSTDPSPSDNHKFTCHIDGEMVSSSSYPAHDVRRRRMLMEEAKMESHLQSGGNYLIISCFTGFGTASLINVNAIVDTPPAMDICLNRLNTDRANYTVTRLREAYNDYYAKNPNALK
jgi:hypothetical protein